MIHDREEIATAWFVLFWVTSLGLIGWLVLEGWI